MLAANRIRNWWRRWFWNRQIIYYLLGHSRWDKLVHACIHKLEYNDTLWGHVLNANLLIFTKWSGGGRFSVWHEQHVMIMFLFCKRNVILSLMHVNEKTMIHRWIVQEAKAVLAKKKLERKLICSSYSFSRYNTLHTTLAV